ncbi:MAG: hypothetical protein SWE60_00660 [Thermodesulfobacteriota bacterium]|nr:hypothetical protein [Thermodesulfobacteriota bacterium]
MKVPKTNTCVIILSCTVVFLSFLVAWPHVKKYVNLLVEENIRLSRISETVEFEQSMIKILHQPKVFTRRYADFTANISGVFSGRVEKATYRLNQGERHDVLHLPPRVPWPLFTIELSPEDLYPGENQLTLEVYGSETEKEAIPLRFTYDPSPITLPIRVDWSNTELDAHDGFWETINVDGTWHVRPKPGFEDYDRLLVVCGAFPGGRRIKTYLIYKYATGNGKPYGFGILPLWGGRPDDVRPRRGWNFSLGWYYSHYHGIGMEFSYKHGDDDLKWVATYLGDYDVEAGTKYFVVIETWPELDPKGSHLRYRQRMKWWAEREQEPPGWMDLADTEGCPIPEGEYAIALNAHRSQVEFGPVLVEPLQSSSTKATAFFTKGEPRSDAGE